MCSSRPNRSKIGQRLLSTLKRATSTKLWSHLTKRSSAWSRSKCEPSKFHRSETSSHRGMVKKEHAAWPIDKKTCLLLLKVSIRTWLLTHTLFHPEWQSVTWLSAFSAKLRLLMEMRVTRHRSKAKLWPRSLNTCTNLATNVTVMKLCTMGSPVRGSRSWSSLGLLFIRGLSTWSETRFTQEVVDPLRSWLDSQLKVGHAMEDFVSVRWSVTAWFRMARLDSWKRGCSIYRTATEFMCAKSADCSARQIWTSSSITAGRATRAKTSARSRFLTLASCFFKNSWPCNWSRSFTARCLDEASLIGK